MTKKTIILYLLLTFNFIALAQKNSQDFYTEDETFHRNEVNKFIESNKKELDSLFYVSSFNYAFDKTLFLFLNKNKIRIYTLENKKFKKKIKCKKIKLSIQEKKRLIKLINENSNINPIINTKNCSLDDTINHYKIEFTLKDEKYITSSRCLNVINNIIFLNKLMELLNL